MPKKLHRACYLKHELKRLSWLSFRRWQAWWAIQCVELANQQGDEVRATKEHKHARKLLGI